MYQRIASRKRLPKSINLPKIPMHQLEISNPLQSAQVARRSNQHSLPSTAFRKGSQNMSTNEPGRSSKKDPHKFAARAMRRARCQSNRSGSI